MTAFVDAIAERLDGRVDGWAVYKHGVPDGALPARYVVVWGTPGDESATTVADVTDLFEPVAWVTSVCRYTDARFAATQVAQSSERVRAALRDWRPPLGRANWKCRNGMSGAPRRDEAIPATTYSAVEQFTALHQA